MGQNDAMRLKGVSNSFGPLWCVPIGGGLAAVWAHLPDGTTLAGVHSAGGFVAPIERHRIFSLGASQTFYILPSRGLQDGQPCRAVFADAAGTRSELILDVRLAPWQGERVPQIISFIISRVLPKRDADSDQGSLERYLSLASSWRARAHVSADVGQKYVYTLGVAPRFVSETLSCFFVSRHRLSRAVIGCIPEGGRTILVTPSTPPERAYVDLGGELVEIEFCNDPVSVEQSIAWLQKLPSAAAHQLLDQLSSACRNESIVVPSYVAKSVTTSDVTLAERGAQLSVQGCFRTSDQLFVFLELMGSASLNNAAIQLFGAKPQQAQVPEALLYEYPVGDGRARARIVLKLAIDQSEASLACRLSATINDQSIACWSHIQAGNGAVSLAFARAFWPLAGHDERYLADILAPLAREWARQPQREPSQILGFSAPAKLGPQAFDLQIIASPDPQMLHNTLIGIRSSLPAAQDIRVVMPSTADVEQDFRRACSWLQRYQLHAHVELLSPSAPASAAAFLKPRQRDQIAVAIRAGFIPPHAKWLEQLTDAALDNPGDAFIGVAPGHDVGVLERGLKKGGVGTVEISREELLRLLQEDAIIGVAASGDLARQIRVECPVCHTLAGAWAEQLLEVLEMGGRVRTHPGLAFWDTRPQCSGDRCDVRIDAINVARRQLEIGQARPVSVSTVSKPNERSKPARRRMKSLGQK